MTNVIIGLLRSIPSQLQSVCVGPDRSDQSGHRFNVSWDPLPCHFQNGADNTDYIIQYSLTSGGEAQNVSNTQMICGQESGGPYRCLIAGSLFIPFQTYNFQVAATNRYGVGPFSDPVSYRNTGLSRYYLHVQCTV